MMSSCDYTAVNTTEDMESSCNPTEPTTIKPEMITITTTSFITKSNSCNNEAIINSREIIVYSIVAAIVCLTVICLLCFFCIRRKLKHIRLFDLKTSDHSVSEFGRKLSTIQNSLRDPKEDTVNIDCIDQQPETDMSEDFPTYSVVRKKSKLSIHDVPPPLPPIMDNDEDDGEGHTNATTDPLYQELPGEHEANVFTNKRGASLYESPLSLADSINNQKKNELSSKIENVLYCEI